MASSSTHVAEPKLFGGLGKDNSPEEGLIQRTYNYMHSFPGDNSSASELESLAAQLQYRELIMACLTKYKNRLGLQAEDCENYDCDAHEIEIYKDSKRKELYSANRHAMRELELFDGPVEHEGHEYIKGKRYVAAIMAEAEWERDTVVNALTELAKWKSDDIIARTIEIREEAARFEKD